jgi:hypothetical protein
MDYGRYALIGLGSGTFAGVVGGFIGSSAVTPRAEKGIGRGSINLKERTIPFTQQKVFGMDLLIL